MIKARVNRGRIDVSAKGETMSLLTELIILNSDILKELLKDTPKELKKPLKDSFLKTLTEVI